MQERAFRTRRVIVEAAAETFESRGYLGASLRDIVTRNSISKGALYFHFRSKEDLAQAIVQEQYDLQDRALGDLRSRHGRAIRVIVELSWHVARMCREDAIMRAGIRLVAEHNLAESPALQPFRSLAGVMEELLIEARAQHDLLPDVDIPSAAAFMSAALEGLQRACVFGSKRGAKARQERPSCVTNMWRYVLPGVVTAECLSDMTAVAAELGREL
jgi:AcrR family transcriptional regulator